jgi:hypothetical protein
MPSMARAGSQIWEHHSSFGSTGMREISLLDLALKVWTDISRTTFFGELCSFQRGFLYVCRRRCSGRRPASKSIIRSVVVSYHKRED